MIRFFDASALVKRYVAEPKSDRVRQLLRHDRNAVSRHTEVEISSALARRHREGSLSTTQHRTLVARLRSDMTELHVVEITPSVVARTHDLLALHVLRAGDALQLAACLEFATAGELEVELVGYDDRLNTAAAAEGIRLTN